MPVDRVSALLRAARPVQWVKNLFVLAPLVFAHRLTDGTALAQAGLAFVAFCLVASAIYLVNDLRDRERDRLHPIKRHRPIAAGELGLGVAAAAAVVLAIAAFAVSAALGAYFAGVLLVYVVLNLLYSWRLKEVVIVDVMIVAAGFVLRVEGGAAAIGVEVSSWLLLCTIFIALFLAFSKRRHELLLRQVEGASERSSRPVLAEYGETFLDQMINVVTASAVVCYALYAMAEQSVVKHGRGLLATLPFVLFGVFRYLYLVYQRPGADTPTNELMTDAPFLVNLALWCLAVAVVIYG